MAQLVKTVQGLAIASVKTTQGLAVASAKTILGLDNTSGGSPAAFSDDFNRANGALGANWTVGDGAADVETNAWRMQTGSFGDVVSVFSGTPCNTANQYVKATFGSVTTQYPALIFRYTDGSSPFYMFLFDGGNGEIQWYYYANVSSSGVQIGTPPTVAGGWNVGDEVGITLNGTGANTDVRIWKNCTGLPSAADNWNGDTSPDATYLTTDPAGNAVDTGTLVGLGGQQSAANSCKFDDFFGGDIP
jgi:hypothetical protein